MATRRPAPARLGLEPLEPRDVPAQFLGVLATAGGIGADHPSVAVAGNGQQFVVAWADTDAMTSTATVNARLYDAAGAALGAPLAVATVPVTAGTPARVAVDMDPTGRFVVAFDQLPDSGSLTDIGLQRYAADGTPVGTVSAVGVATRVESLPVVSLSDTGSVLVAYRKTTSDGLTHRFDYQVYNAFTDTASTTTTSISSTGALLPTAQFGDASNALVSGTLLSGVGGTAPFRRAGGSLISASTSLTLTAAVAPVITRAPGADAWRVISVEDSGGTYQLVARAVTYTSSSPTLDPQVVLATGVSGTAPLSARTDAAGNTVVVYALASGALVAETFSAAGAPVGAAVTLSGTAVESYSLGLGAAANQSLVVFASPDGSGAFELRGVLLSDPPPPPPPPPPPGPDPAPSPAPTPSPSPVPGPVLNAPDGTGTIRVLNPDGTTRATVTPYTGYAGRVVTTAADMTADGTADVVTGADGHVKVFDGTTGTEAHSFFAFDGYRGGLHLGAGDLTGDGVADLVVTADTNGHVKVFDGATGGLVASFFAFEGYRGAVAATVGDTDGDGRNELIVAAGAAAGAHVKAFDPAILAVSRSFVVAGAGGARFALAAGDLDGDDRADLVVAQGTRVTVIDGGTGAARGSFDAFEDRFLGVMAVQVDGDDILAAAEINGRVHVKGFDGQTFDLLDSYFPDQRAASVA
ncbi:FG-GAP repeat protein [Gemmata obscuriglobus]|uniref:VCBS repeat-containing protein n=1 Tax=Gemmata obscuriglobus TaxID=114 RepID=A0A2Z3H210_9BACT|nr:VCBS repeat-containing protein [Gemmata obscuriglobus]AWM37175.1 VCBS repeat-containing protein [Gemmata obscuriglobus]QEG30091.1 FG-GAP repeat protein [Gemmata obscuriglobus]VTS09412.1 Hemolysin-type calcium-binding region domain protein OS=Rhodopirellula maiorica SM1 GN=RMSM_03614 PE=4 SV=1: VCBS [Gemmata obscuriglobus UQM 2246]